MTNNSFSQQLQTWLKSKNQKSITSLVNAFGSKSFAVSLLLLMSIPALPLPTGGITHIFELIAMIIAIQMIFGRQTIWLPKRWLQKDISGLSNKKFVARIIKYTQAIEARSKVRLGAVYKKKLFIRLSGVFCVVFCLAAFLAPPFSGLDTLPSLAVIFITLSLIFEDMLLYMLGLLTGAVGIAVIATAGIAIFKSFKILF